MLTHNSLLIKFIRIIRSEKKLLKKIRKYMHIHRSSIQNNVIDGQ